MFFRGGVEALDIPLRLGVPVEQLQPKGGRLGVDAVSTPDGRRVLELKGALFQHRGKLVEARR
jgi:hypothetical protein